jgi:CheY-like chemotaxis protein
MNALIVCRDTNFLPTMDRVLKQFGVNTQRCPGSDSALALLAEQRMDCVVLDWQEIMNLGEFLDTLKQSKINKDCILVGIAGDLLDLRQAFAAGVQYLIHKPPATAQISGCLRAAYSAMMVQRRKTHREPARISVALRYRNTPLLGAIILNSGAAGVGLKFSTNACKTSARVSPGDELELSFTLPGTKHMIYATGVVAWMNANGESGVEFRYVSETDKPKLQEWLAAGFERSVSALRERSDAGCA